jgi:hypothetical protein
VWDSVSPNKQPWLAENAPDHGAQFGTLKKSPAGANSSAKNTCNAPSNVADPATTNQSCWLSGDKPPISTVNLPAEAWAKLPRTTCASDAG